MLLLADLPRRRIVDDLSRSRFGWSLLCNGFGAERLSKSLRVSTRMQRTSRLEKYLVK